MHRQPFGIARHQRRKARRDGKAVLGQPDRRLQKPGPVGAAPAAMRLGHQGGGSGCADTAPADHSLEELQRRAVSILKQARRRCQRGGFAPVKRGDLRLLPHHARPERRRHRDPRIAARPIRARPEPRPSHRRRSRRRPVHPPRPATASGCAATTIQSCARTGRPSAFARAPAASGATASVACCAPATAAIPQTATKARTRCFTTASFSGASVAPYSMDGTT